MKLRIPIVLLGLLLFTGCRQTDGPMPVPEGEDVERLSDLARDLLNVAAHAPQGRQEFVQDLAVYADDKPSEGVMTTFGMRVSDAVEEARLTEPSAQALASALWVVVAGTELSPRQVEDAQNNLKAQLTAAGASVERSDAVAAEVTNVQEMVSTRPRRWWELF